MNITYYIKNVYGQEKIYLADDNQRRAVMMITGQRTVTPNVMKGLLLLGFSFTRVLEPAHA